MSRNHLENRYFPAIFRNIAHICLQFPQNDEILPEISKVYISDQTLKKSFKKY